MFFFLDPRACVMLMLALVNSLWRLLDVHPNPQRVALCSTFVMHVSMDAFLVR